MFKNINIEQKIDKDIVVIIFEFDVTNVMKESTLMIKVWDENRNASRNYFYNAIKVVNNSDSEQTTVNDNSSNILDKITKNESEIPEWVKNSAGWWAAGQVEDDSFISGIQFMIKEGILAL